MKAIAIMIPTKIPSRFNVTITVINDIDRSFLRLKSLGIASPSSVIELKSFLAIIRVATVSVKIILAKRVSAVRLFAQVRTNVN